MTICATCVLRRFLNEDPATDERERHNRHHRRAKADKGSNDPHNISIVPEAHHRAFHNLFGLGKPHDVAKILNDTWIDPDFELIVRRRE